MKTSSFLMHFTLRLFTKGPVNISRNISTVCKGNISWLLLHCPEECQCLSQQCSVCTFPVHLIWQRSVSLQIASAASLASLVGTKRLAGFYFKQTWAEHNSLRSMHLDPTSRYLLNGFLHYNPPPPKKSHECNCQRRHFYPMLCLHTSRTTFDGIRITKDVL